MKNIVVRKYGADDIPAMKDIWNEVVDEGIAFPQEEDLTDEGAKDFFAQQTYCGVAVGEDGKIYGMYILHPNNIGRCGHIANASYAVSLESRGLHIGESWFVTVLFRQKRTDSEFFNSMRLLRRIFMQDTFMRESGSNSSAQFPAASEWTTDITRTSVRIILKQNKKSGCKS